MNHARDLRRAMVLGGAGFLGGWLLDALFAEGVETTVLDPRPANRSTAQARFISDSLTADSVARHVGEHTPDVVFHLAGAGSVPPSVDDPLRDLDQNVSTTLEALEGLRISDRDPLFVFVSSAAVYGEARSDPIAEDHPLQPRSPYGVSKLAAESYVQLYSRLHGISGLIVRPFSVYGPGQRKLVIYDLLTRILRAEDPLRILGSPDVSRDFVFVGDVTQALTALARTAPCEGEVYNLASGVATTLGDLAANLIQLAGTNTHVQFTGRVRPGETLHWTGDPSRARSLGVRCDTPLSEGLGRTVQWLRQVAATSRL